MDAWDWNFAGVYDDAKKRDDKALQQEVVSNYLSYHTAVFDYFEKLSKDLLGYEPRQILLLHANNLEADHIRELIELLRKRGYRFITLEEALSDGAYGLPDTYVGEEGRGWIEHWAKQWAGHRGAPLFFRSLSETARNCCLIPSHEISRSCTNQSQGARRVWWCWYSAGDPVIRTI